jgi:hypothetical protein
MSLATLKAKSLAMYGTHSDKSGFSLNGPLRQPPLGANLGRSVTRTPFRGPAPMGHGMGSRCRVGGWRARTCGGTYPLNIRRSSLGTPQTLVKQSVMNQKGMIETKYTGILHGAYPRSHVFHVQTVPYIERIGKEVLACPVIKGEYTQGLQANKKSRCTPYTKTVLDMDYKRYYAIQDAGCNQLGEPFKIFKACGIA